MSRRSTRHQIDLILLYLFPILSYYGYYYVGFNLTTMKALYFIALPLMIIYVWKTFIHRNRSKYFNKIRLLTILIGFSMVMSYVLWDQPFILSYRVTAGSLAIIYYFFLVKGNFSQKEIEIYIWINAFLWILMWLYAFSQAPTPVFAFDTEEQMDDTRGIFRISIAGRACVFIAYFMSLNKWVTTKEKRYIILAGLFFTFIVLMTVRQSIIFSFLVGLYYLIRKIRYSWLYIFLLFIIFQFVSVKIDNNSIIGSLIELSEKQINDQEKGDTYIRFLEYKYFFTKYNNHPLAILFGNGNPHSEHLFGQRELRIKNTLGYYQSDVGYGKIYVMIGLIGLILFCRLLIIPIKQKVRADITYAKLFMIYAILVHIGTQFIISSIIVICIAIYLLDKNEEDTSKIQHNNSSIQTTVLKRMY